MMKKATVYALVLGFCLGYLVFIALDEISNNKKIVESEIIHGEHMEMNHQHEKIHVGDVIPELDVEVYKDTTSGYNVHIITKNFEWKPEAVNTEPIDNQGHAHIYINDEKIARVYGDWFHIDDHHILDTSNTLRVTLNANNHAEWSIDDNPIEFITPLF